MDAFAPVVIDYGTFDLTPRYEPEVRPAPSLQQIKALQDVLMALPQVDCPVQHFFSPGQYLRVCFIKAGALVVGKMHRHQHPAILLSGTAVINTDRGMETIHGWHVWTSQPNAKRAVAAITDCVFLTVHLNPDNLTDPDELEALLIVPEAQIDYETPQEAAFLSDAVQGAYA